MQKVALLSRLLVGGVLIASTLISSCAKKEDIIQPINGYFTADAVDSLNLVAHWSFDGDLIESKTGTIPINIRNTGFGQSFKGQCLTLDDGFLEYPPITKLNTGLQSAFTITAWVLLKNNGATQSNIISLANQNTLINNNGNVTFCVRTDYADPTASILFPTAILALKRDTTNLEYDVFTNPGDTTNLDYKNEGIYEAGKWVQLAMRFNSNDTGKTSLDILANGRVVSWPAIRNLIYNKVPLGALNFISPSHIVIGTFPTSDQGLGFNAVKTSTMANFKGAIDEIRIYNKALPTADINTIYQLEKLAR